MNLQNTNHHSSPCSSDDSDSVFSLRARAPTSWDWSLHGVTVNCVLREKVRQLQSRATTIFIRVVLLSIVRHNDTSETPEVFKTLSNCLATMLKRCIARNFPNLLALYSAPWDTIFVFVHFSRYNLHNLQNSCRLQSFRISIILQHRDTFTILTQESQWTRKWFKSY